MATFPLYQPEFGWRLPRTHESDVDLPYYRFVKLGKTNGSSPEKYITLAGVGDTPIGVVIPEVGRDMMVQADTSGYGDGMMPRTGYVTGKDYPQIHIAGVVHVIASTGVIAGEYAVVTANGKAGPFTPQSIPASGGTVMTQAQLVAMRDENNLIAGVFLDSGSSGDYVRIFMGKR